MPFRLTAPTSPVEISLDGEIVVAEDGEPIAFALLAADAVALARSPKFHRPRGPACLRGACDGCLMRVDGQPNVMTCLVPACSGTKVQSQNTLGSRNVDLLRVTDWFFPEGMNHHELFAGVPGVQGVMQAFARRVAGLGRIPETNDESPAAPSNAKRPAVRRKADVVIVGGGPAGLAVAAALAQAGRDVEVIDDGLAIGGSLPALGATFSDFSRAVLPVLEQKKVRMRAKTVAGAVFPDGLLVVGPEATEVLEARALVLAPGAHDGVLAFEGNDMPGIFSARAAMKLLSRGIAVGEKVVVATLPGGGPYGELFRSEVERMRAPIEVTVVADAPIGVTGAGRVKEVVFPGDKKNLAFRADALLVDAPRAPSYELCAQAGAELEHIEAGFVVRTQQGRIRAGIYAAGEVTGTPLEPQAILAEAAALAEVILVESDKRFTQ